MKKVLKTKLKRKIKKISKRKSKRVSKKKAVTTAINEKGECPICCEERPLLTTKCKHQLCQSCFNSVDKCPFCRAKAGFSKLARPAVHFSYMGNINLLTGWPNSNIVALPMINTVQLY